jgi:arsenite methyltransferase
MTQAVRDKLRATIVCLHLDNIEVLDGTAEYIPLPDQSVDVVTSNCVLNLVPNKGRLSLRFFGS